MPARQQAGLPAKREARAPAGREITDIFLFGRFSTYSIFAQIF